MNKYTYFALGFLTLSTVAWGECVGGKWITANSTTNNPNGDCTATTCNGKTFCVSDGSMNWWSAFTWCASNDLELASFSDMCPGVTVDMTQKDGACRNLNGVSGAVLWTNLGAGDSGAFHVYPNGMISKLYGRADSPHVKRRACCE